MSRIFVFNHPIFLSGSHGMSTSPTTAITNRANITASLFTDQDISTTGTPIFYESNFSGSIDVADGKWTIQKVGDSVTITPSGSFDVTGSLGVLNGFTVQQDMVVDGILKGRDFITELETASVIFPSGSTKFGDSTDDKHPFSGSLLIGNDMSRSIDLTIPHTGSEVPVLYNITEFRNVPFPSGSFEQTQPITEYAGVNLIAPFSANQRYNRKCFAKKAISITTDVATFNAESASAPRSEDETLFEQLPVTDENDFMFFRNGMVMEQDALSIQQSGSLFLLTINSNGLGYELETTDEIIAWGKFNS